VHHSAHHYTAHAMRERSQPLSRAWCQATYDALLRRRGWQTAGTAHHSGIIKVTYLLRHTGIGIGIGIARHR
jgi:hypothetical protein